MKKFGSLAFSLFLILVFVVSGNSQTNSKISPIKSTKKKNRTQRSQKPKFVCQYFPGVVALELSQVEIVLNCPAVDVICLNKPSIKVTVVTIDSGQQKYVYTVSAGKIVGEGANVEWDLSGVKPGNYTITSGISQPIFDDDRWEVTGTTKTKTITIKE